MHSIQVQPAAWHHWLQRDTHKAGFNLEICSDCKTQQDIKKNIMVIPTSINKEIEKYFEQSTFFHREFNEFEKNYKKIVKYNRFTFQWRKFHGKMNEDAAAGLAAASKEETDGETDE